MKKLILTTSMILALTLGGIAQEGGGMLRRSSEYEEARKSNRMGGNGTPMFPSQHGLNDDYDADGPLGSGIAVLVGLGAAYLVGKKRKED